MPRTGHSTGNISGDAANRPLRPRQLDVLRAIEEYVQRHDRPPTVREIASDANIASLAHVANLLAALERRGHITIERGVSRGIHLTRPSGVRILGTIAAGSPLDLFDNVEQPETLDLGAHAHIGGSAQDSQFALRVRGDSMIEDGILDGDYVLVQPGKTAPEGAIVVAVHLDGGGERGAATLKRIRLERSRGRVLRVLLCPANAALLPIEVPVDEWRREWAVQGTVTAIYRPYRQVL
ncbi:MAG TPA: transcriptional repressor LexA [Ktedonobacterales bacterium]|nr:transcriptional repressor LexA [Ktedonobacterales bacterium]